MAVKQVLGLMKPRIRPSAALVFFAIATPVSSFLPVFHHMRPNRALGLRGVTATATEQRWRGPGNPFKKIEVYKPSFGDG
jgi:hypothetical protein